jgi:hypothetical protein
VYNHLSAQNFGGFGTKNTWQFIESKHTRVIYNPGMENQARRILHLSTLLAEKKSRSVYVHDKKIDILLHNKTTTANGYVGLAPWRSAFFATPPENFSNLGSVNWLDALTIHEYRHHQQFMNSLEGITKIAKLIFGDIGHAAFSNLALPNWYFEGDAVIMETALTKGGRGRNPYFFQLLKANYLDHKTFEYHELRNSSFVEKRMNHYTLGYLMQSYIRKTYGNDIMKKVVAQANSFDTPFHTFKNSLQDYTGKTTKEIYKLALNDFNTKYQNHLNRGEFKNYSSISPKQTANESYYYPQFSIDGEKVFAIKTSYNDLETLVSIKNGIEQKICSVGRNSSKNFHENNGAFVWTAFSNNTFEYNHDYKNIYLFKDNKKQKITHKGKFHSPQITKDHLWIYALSFDEQNNSSIHKISVKNGEKNTVKVFPKEEYIAQMTLREHHNEIFYIKRKNQKLAVFRYDLSKGIELQLCPWTHHIIDNLRVFQDKILLSSSLGGDQNIFFIPTDRFSENSYKLTQAKIGAYQPDVYHNQLIFTQTNSNGFEIQSTNLKSQYLKPISVKENSTLKNFPEANFQLEGGDILDHFEEPKNSPIAKKYRSGISKIKLHSRYFDLRNNKIELVFDGRDILNENKVQLRAGWNREFNLPYFGFDYHFKRNFLKSVHLSFNARWLRSSNNIVFNETDLALKYPLVLLGTEKNAHYFVKIEPRVRVFSRFRRFFEKIPMGTQNKYDAGLKLDSYWIRRPTIQQIIPKFGVRQFSDFYSSDQALYSKTTLYFPGITKNHGIQMEYQFQKMFDFTGVFANFYFSNPKGYILKSDLEEGHAFKFAYRFPLSYPDFGYGDIGYFKRISASVFYDFSNEKRKDKFYTFNSIGAGIFFDKQMLNLIPLKLGLEFAYLLNTDPLDKNRKFAIIPTINLNF